MTQVVIDILFTPGPVRYVAPPAMAPSGGECVFLGRTRAEMHDKHGPLRLLRYTAYETMAEQVLQSLAKTAVAQYSALFVRLHHSVGDVAIGEASVLVQVLSAHREEAFAACRMLIDRLKSEAPIWKNEVWADGTTWSRGQDVPPTAFAEGRHDMDEEVL